MAHQIQVGQPTVPDLDGTLPEIEIGHRRATEVSHRQNLVQLAVAFPQHIRQQKALLGHAVEDLRQRHRADRRGESVTGEVAHQHEHVAGRVACGQQHVAVENRHRRYEVTDVVRTQAARMGDAVEDILRSFLFSQQARMVLADFIALGRNHRMHLPHAFQRDDLGAQNHLIVGLRQEVIATRDEATGQLVGLGQ